jgi:hypothetical protein
VIPLRVLQAMSDHHCMFHRRAFQQPYPAIDPLIDIHNGTKMVP